MKAPRRKPRRRGTSESRQTDPVTAYALAVSSGEIIAGPHVRDACRRHLDDLEHGPERGLTFDVERAEWAMSFFPAVLCLNGGEFEGVPFELLPWQQFIVGSLFGWLGPDGYRRFRVAYIETGKGPLALDTMIPTPHGWTAMANIKVGDRVFDERGIPCNVTAVSPIFENRKCYRLRFSDGCEIVADADHRWRTAALRSGGRPGPKSADAPRKGGYAIRTTAQIGETFELPPSASAHPQAKWNHRIDVAGPLDLPEAELPVPPYTLGVWLGDGDSDCARITCAYDDWQVIEEIRSEGVPATERRKHSETTARVLLGHGRGIGHPERSIQARLREIGVLGNKHIPQRYLRASPAQRLALLQGLMDADGSALKGGDSELTLCNEGLALGAVELIRSLGFKPMVRCADAVLNGRVVGIRWRIKVRAYADVPIFRLRRKAQRLKARPATRPLSKGRMIVACDPVPSVPVRCITVDSRSHLFLAGEGMIPTHNSGKSPLVAGIGLLMLTVDGEARAEVYAAAVKKDQAKVLFRDAVAMVQQSPDLACRVTIGGGQDPVNLAYLESGSFFRPISSEDRGRGQSGPRPHCALLDEVHEHPTVSMIEFLRAGTKGRRQALIAMITNSGSNRQSPCFEYHQYAAQVCRGEREDDGFFGYVCALDEGDQRRGIPQDDPFKDESCWVKANPSLPDLPGMKYLREQVREAKGLPSKEALVRRLNFCQWVDAANPLFEREVWFAVLHHLDFEEYRGRRCWLAIDLSGKADLTAMAIAFESDHGLDVFVEYWTPRDTLAERASRDRWPYVEWEREGYLTGVPGRSIDYAWVAARIAEIADAHEVVGIGFDRYRIDDLERELDEASVEHYRGDQEESGYGIPMYPIGQGFKDMSPAVEAFETAVLNGAMRIDLNPVTTMCAANAVVTKDAAENRKFDKSKATGRIDGMVAIAMVTRLATRPDDDGPSIYETERLTTLG